MPAYKGRVLFFHGYTQSSLIFYAKTSALRKKLIKLNYKCIYLNGPYKLTPADFPSNDVLSKFNSVPVSDDGDTNLRAWWVKPNKLNENVLMDSSFDTIKDYIDNNKLIEDEDLVQKLDDDDKNLPVMGLIGFSQGSALIGLIMNKFNRLFNTDLKFVILYSGFKLNTSEGSGNESYNHYYDIDQKSEEFKKNNFRVLHVHGELDTVVSEERAMTLYKYSKDYSDLLRHPGGHFVPNSKIYVEQVTNWISQSSARQPEADGEQKPKPKEENLDDLLEMMDNIGKV